MKTSKSEYVRMLRVKFAQAEKDGLAIDYKMIDGYLGEVEKLAETDTMFDAVAIAQINAEQAGILAESKRAADADLEMLRSVISHSVEAYKAGLLINGGAAVALLALVGHSLSARAESRFTDGLAGPLLWFVVGVMLAAITSGVAYLTQRLYQMRWIKSAGASNLVAVLLMLASYAAFLVGCIGAYRVFTGLTHL